MQVFLTTPIEYDEDSFSQALLATLQTGMVSALLIRRAGLNELTYQARVSALQSMAQSSDCAVLLEDCPELVRKFGADGVHMSSGQQKFATAIQQLKPQFIVGAGDISSRHEAMIRGEAGADYILFGSLDHAPDDKAQELASWWNELFETPCVLSDPKTPVTKLNFNNSEFIGLGQNIWSAQEGAASSLKSILQRATNSRKTSS